MCTVKMTVNTSSLQPQRYIIYHICTVSFPVISVCLLLCLCNLYIYRKVCIHWFKAEQLKKKRFLDETVWAGKLTENVNFFLAKGLVLPLFVTNVINRKPTGKFCYSFFSRRVQSDPGCCFF